MNHENSKITHMHLSKTAILYIRQSTLRQVYENSESTRRQYALKDRLACLGWPVERVRTIDQDLGKSGADAESRSGFQDLIGAVAGGLVGAVASIECSRLSRSSADWARLTQFCAYTGTLLIDADGVYDPNDFNDRLLLGLKATMSEAELHFLNGRMRGGLLNKARRGELKVPMPVGYVHDGGRIAKDPDAEVQNVVGMLFDTFRRTGSAHGVVRHFNSEGYRFPRKSGDGPLGSGAEWVELRLRHVLGILHNPCYAGVYSYGRTQTAWTPDGKKSKAAPREDWHAFIKDHHDAYISFEDFEENERRLCENNSQMKGGGKRTAAREGPSLLQGLVWCGKCGCRMGVRYSCRGGQAIPVYVCQRDSLEKGGRTCQYIDGQGVDGAIAGMLSSRLTPEAVAQSVAVQKELDKRQDESLNYYQMRVDRCKQEAALARRRFMAVDPDNRLVALELESDWNLKIKRLDDAMDEYGRQAEKAEKGRGARDYEAADRLAENFSEMFDSDAVSLKDKKRMARYLIEDVMLVKLDGAIKIQIRYKGYTTQSVTIDAPKRSNEKYSTPPDVIESVRMAAETLIVEDIAALLNEKGLVSGKGKPFTPTIVKRIMHAYGIPNKKDRLLARGYVVAAVKAASLGITADALYLQIRSGEYRGECVRVNSRNEYVFPPTAHGGITVHA